MNQRAVSAISSLSGSDSSTSSSSLWRSGKVFSSTVHAFVERDNNSKGFHLIKRVADQHFKGLSDKGVPVNSKPLPLIPAGEPFHHRITRQLHHQTDDKVDGVLLQSVNVAATPLPSQQEDDELQKTLASYEATIDGVNLKLEALSVEKEKVERSNRRLRGRISEQQTALQTAINLTQLRLQEQTDLISQQYTMIQRMSREKEEASALLDMACVVVSVFIIRTPVMQYTIRLMTGYAGKLGNKPARIAKLLQYMAIFQTYSLLKSLSQKVGIASRLWRSFSWLFNKSKAASAKVVRSFGLLGRLPGVMNRTIPQSSPSTDSTLAIC